LERSTPNDGLAERINQFINAATPLLDLVISGPFKEYTLHNRNHSKKLLHLADYLIPSQTLSNLSILDLSMIIYSCYLHDMGMCLTSIERKRILDSDEFIDVLQNWPEVRDALQHSRDSLSTLDAQQRLSVEAEIFQLQEAALCAYLRPRHARPERYRTLINLLKQETHRPDLFELNGISFERQLVDICASHNLDIGVLSEVYGPYEERFPRDLVLAGERINTQFCAAVLRLVDILDFDRERTPNILFESLSISTRSLPGAEVSLLEWQKHMAIHSMAFNDDEIIISAESRNPVIEKAIKDFCNIIEREIRDTLAVLRRNPQAITSLYALELPITVRPRIRSIGYVFKDIQLRLNQSVILSLLMGERLYLNPAVALRELIQNSIDACDVLMKIEGKSGYKPQIAITNQIDELNIHWIEISDNGIGMDEYVLSEYFFTLGNSYYDSPEFQRMILRSGDAPETFTPISRFGIGVASAFMIADVMEVYTRRRYSPRGDDVSRFVRVERMGGLAYVTEPEEEEKGTRIRLRLRPEFQTGINDFIAQVVRYLIDNVVRPKFNITINLFQKQVVLNRNNTMSLKSNAKSMLSDQGIELIVLDLSRWSNRISGVVLLLLARDQNGCLSHKIHGEQIRLGHAGIDAHSFIDNYVGNRLTVNGMKMSHDTLRNILEIDDQRVTILLDIDICGDEKIIYDISRNRIMGRGKKETSEAFREAIIKGLEETGISQQLSSETLDLIQNHYRLNRNRKQKFRHVTDGDLLKLVAEQVPESKWPINLHRIVAQRLKIPNSVAYRAITTLITTGVIIKPEGECESEL